MGRGEMIMLSIDSPLHFTVAIKDSAFVDGEDRGNEISIELTGRMYLHTSLGDNLSFNAAIDDNGIRLDLSFDNCGLTNNQCSALEDLSFELPLQTKYALEGHLPLKDDLLTEITADLL